MEELIRRGVLTALAVVFMFTATFAAILIDALIPDNANRYNRHQSEALIDLWRSYDIWLSVRGKDDL